MVKCFPRCVSPWTRVASVVVEVGLLGGKSMTSRGFMCHAGCFESSPKGIPSALGWHRLSCCGSPNKAECEVVERSFCSRSLRRILASAVDRPTYWITQRLMAIESWILGILYFLRNILGDVAMSTYYQPPCARHFCESHATKTKKQLNIMTVDDSDDSWHSIWE